MKVAVLCAHERNQVGADAERVDLVLLLGGSAVAWKTADTQSKQKSTDSEGELCVPLHLDKLLQALLVDACRPTLGPCGVRVGWKWGPHRQHDDWVWGMDRRWPPRSCARTTACCTASQARSTCWEFVACRDRRDPTGPHRTHVVQLNDVRAVDTTTLVTL
jgi:hypothetical protein